MKEDIAKAWIDRLESGELKQGRGSLLTIYRNEEGEIIDCEYCGMGVLCQLAVEAGVTVMSRNGSFGVTLEKSQLPLEVVEWAGMVFPLSRTGRFGNAPLDSVVAMNDSDKSFHEIAEVLRKNWEKL